SEPLVLFSQSMRGKNGHRRRVEPTTQKASDWMDAAHLPAHGTIETITQSFRVGGVGSESDILDIRGRPVAALCYRSVGFHVKNVRRRGPKNISIHPRCMIGLVWHQRNGERFFSTASRALPHFSQPAPHPPNP